MILTLYSIHVGTEVAWSVGIMSRFFRSRMIQIPGQIYSGDGANNLVRNIDKGIPGNTASHSRRL